MRRLLHLLTLVRGLAADHVFWIAVRRWSEDGKDHLVIVKPETVLRWHREACRRFSGLLSRRRTGRRSLTPERIALIRRPSRENLLRGAEGQLMAIG